MFFKRKIDRVVDQKASEESFKKTLKNTPLEKNDALAMIIAALLVLLPAVLIVGGFFVLVIWFFFMR